MFELVDLPKADVQLFYIDLLGLLSKSLIPGLPPMSVQLKKIRPYGQIFFIGRGERTNHSDAPLALRSLMVRYAHLAPPSKENSDCHWQSSTQGFKSFINSVNKRDHQMVISFMWSG